MLVSGASWGNKAAWTTTHLNLNHFRNFSQSPELSALDLEPASAGSGMINFGSGSDKLQFLQTKIAWNLLGTHWLPSILLRGQQKFTWVGFKNLRKLCFSLIKILLLPPYWESRSDPNPKFHEKSDPDPKKLFRIHNTAWTVKQLAVGFSYREDFIEQNTHNKIKFSCR